MVTNLKFIRSNSAILKIVAITLTIVTSISMTVFMLHEIRSNLLTTKQASLPETSTDNATVNSTSGSESMPDVQDPKKTNAGDPTASKSRRYAEAIEMLADNSKTENWMAALNILAFADTHNLYRTVIRDFIASDTPAIVELHEFSDIIAAKKLAVALLGSFRDSDAVSDLKKFLDVSGARNAVRGLDKLDLPDRYEYRREMMPYSVINAALFGLGVCGTNEAHGIITQFQDEQRRIILDTLQELGVDPGDQKRYDIEELRYNFMLYKGTVDSLVMYKMRQENRYDIEYFYNLEENINSVMQRYEELYRSVDPLAL